MPEIYGGEDAREAIESRKLGQCWCDWRPGVECPNEAEFVVQNLEAPGYMRCCGLHKDGFMALGPAAVKVWTVQEWKLLESTIMEDENHA